MSLRKNLLIDMAAFIGLLLSMEPRFTGIAVHEWFCLAFTGLIITHIVIHWGWVVATGKRFIKNILSLSRLRLVLDVLVFISFTVVMLSGILISESVLALFGLDREAGEEMRRGLAGGMPGLNLNQGSGFDGAFPGGFRPEGMGAAFSWRRIHDISANLTILLVALHVALNWEWVNNACRRLVITPFMQRRRVGLPVEGRLAPVTVNQKQNRGSDV